jgi:molybdate transport system substrate-binding protein
MEVVAITAFAAALHTRAQNPDAAKALIKYLSAAAAAPIIKKAGMEP